MSYIDKKRINIRMWLSDEQVGWLIDQDSCFKEVWFKEVLDNTQCRSYEDSRFTDLINVYETNTYGYLDEFMEIINLISSRQN